MVKLKLWDKQTPLIYANGRLASAAKVFEDYPFSQYAPTVLDFIEEVDAGIMVGGLDPLYTLRKNYGISENMSDEEAAAEIEKIRNTPPLSEPSTEERIAAALEFQTLLSLSDTM